MPSSTTGTGDGAMALAVSNHAVRLLSQYTGRGATKARTYFEDDLVTVVIEDLLTTGERSLATNGDAALILDMRRAYQAAMAADLVAGVESITGRSVAAFLSANHLDPDVAVETFVLKPA